MSKIVDNCCLWTYKPINLFVFFAIFYLPLSGSYWPEPDFQIPNLVSYRPEHGILKSFRFLINQNRNSSKVLEFGFFIWFRSSSSGGSVCANIIDTKGCQKYKGISTYCDRRFTKMNSVSGFPKHVQNIIVSIYFWMIWKWAWTGFGPVWTCFDPHWTSFGPGSRLLWTIFGPDWTRFGPGLRFVLINLAKNVA